ncbi:OTU-like cysteine protease [Plasmodium ovale curtisi]|uniref:OTU-like cysteine protease n=1 Tax=Plasmodium ovale curtisi TaxID=864141 RepID=A0A1A8VMT5_PLAOA|nr:OTU-like cysteine protease [Plasmodium ovale curtisi]
MKKQKRNGSQHGNKTKDEKNNNYEEGETPNRGITYSMINDYHDSNFKKNFYIKSIRTDGNCLFRAVSDQLYNYEDNYKEIRKRVVDHLLQNEDKYKNFLEYDESYKSYIDRISLDGTWGGQLELQAVGELFNVNILIYQENGCILEIKNHSDEKKCIQLHYASSEHYNSVRFKNRALENELKSILDLREILNNKEENDSTKTFYETTENEITEDNEDYSSGNIRNDNKLYDNMENVEFSFNSSIDEDHLSDYYTNSKDGFRRRIYRCQNEICNGIFSMSEEEREINSTDVLQGIAKGIRRKKCRSRSMPGINDQFLYFFSKSVSNNKIESDSTIDNLNDRKNNVDRKKEKKKEKKKINLLKCNYIPMRNEDLWDNTGRENDNERKIVRISYNKTFYKYIGLCKTVEGLMDGGSTEGMIKDGIDKDNIFHGAKEDNYGYNRSSCYSHEHHICNDKQCCSNVCKNYPHKRYNSWSRKGYISNYELENNFNKTRKKEFQDFISLYSEKIPDDKMYFDVDKGTYYYGMRSKKENSSMPIVQSGGCSVCGGCAGCAVCGAPSDETKCYYLNSEYARSSSINKCSSAEENMTYSLYLDKGMTSFETKNSLVSKTCSSYTHAEGDLHINSVPINTDKYIANFKKNHLNIFDIIIDDYAVVIDSNSLFSHMSNRHFGKNGIGVCGTSSSGGQNANNATKGVSLPANLVGNDVVESRNYGFDGNIGRDSGRENGSGSLNVTTNEVWNGRSSIRDLTIKRKYQHKKFLNLFSKDIFSKSLFHFLNADYFLNEEKIKYIIPFFFRSCKKVNIFKNDLNKEDFHFCEYVSFSFNINKQKLQKKKECSKVSYEEFLLKEEHKYNKLIRVSSKGPCSDGKGHTSDVKIISI